MVDYGADQREEFEALASIFMEDFVGQFCQQLLS